MKLIKIDKAIHLPSIKPNKIYHNSNISNKLAEKNSNLMKKISFSNEINSNVQHKRKTNSIEIIKPIRSRLRNIINNSDNINGLDSFNNSNYLLVVIKIKEKLIIYLIITKKAKYSILHIIKNKKKIIMEKI